jgi:ABC-type phosphate transport system substrate-binding protein
MKKAIIIVSAVFILCSAGSAETIIIVNNTVPVSQISETEARNIFLGKKTTWDNGTEINVGMLNGGVVHEDILEQVVKKSSSQFETYWKRRIFTGSGQAPSTFSQELELVEFVAATSGAVGYVDAATPHPNVRVVFTK